MTIDIILFLGTIILIGYAANVFSQKTRIPESMILILIGLLVGPVFKLIDPADLHGIVGPFATVAIIIILIDSGLDFDISFLLKKILDASIFTILGNILITVSVGLMAHFLFQWNLLHGLLLGIVSSGTTTVMVHSLLEGLDINKETKNLLILESILNDTTLIIFAVTIIGLIKGTPEELISSIFSSIRDFFLEFFLGLFLGICFFLLWLEIIKLIPLRRKRNYVFILGLLFILYGTAELLGGSGILAVLVFSLFLGNLSPLMKYLNLKERYCTREHIQSLKSIALIQLDFSFFIRTFFFVFLGITSEIHIITLNLVLMAFAIIGLLILTRYISVMAVSLLDRKYNKHALLISTMVPRGFVATLLAFLPFNEGISIPSFPELVLLLILFTSIISILGTIVFRIKDDKHKKKKSEETQLSLADIDPVA
ncbi:cation:proton antiporter [Candidatus Woesearchaeota archaeon]|nr:cation:proton antiporter [Candidatus Woesearchaeota archaeon]